MTQLSYGSYVAGHNGEAQQVVRSMSRTNGVATQKVITLTIDTATNDHVYTISLTFPGQLSGIDFSYTADGSATKAEIQAGLLAAWNASAIATGRATVATSGSDKLVFTAVAIGVDFTISESDAKMSLVTSGGGDPDLIPFGRLCVPAASGDGSQCREANNSSLALVSYDLTPVAVSNSPYTVTIGVEGFEYTGTYVSDGSATVAEITAGIVAALNAQLPDDTLTAADNTTKVTLTSDKAGLDFSIGVGGPGSGAWTIAEVTEGMLLPLSCIGMARYSAEFAASEDASGNAGYPAYKQVSLLQQGTILVATAASVSPGDDVYYGTTGADMGVFSNDAGSTAANWVLLDQANFAWVKRLSSTQALLAIDLNV